MSGVSDNEDSCKESTIANFSLTQRLIKEPLLTDPWYAF